MGVVYTIGIIITRKLTFCQIANLNYTCTFLDVDF